MCDFDEEMRVPSLALSLVLAGCAMPSSTRVAISLPPKSAADVAIIKSLPSRPYIVVAEFQGIGLSDARIRSIGGRLGADAVYVTNYNITFAAADTTVAGPGTRQTGLNSESLCTAITYR